MDLGNDISTIPEREKTTVMVALSGRRRPLAHADKNKTRCETSSDQIETPPLHYLAGNNH